MVRITKYLRSKLILFAFLITTLIYAWLYSSSVTPLDRSFFLSDKKDTLVVTYVDWMCNCANFVDITKYKINPVIELGKDDYFFIEPSKKELEFDRNYFINNKYIRLVGKFYLDRGIPKEYPLGQIEDKPDHAKIFKYSSIEYLTDMK